MSELPNLSVLGTQTKRTNRRRNRNRASPAKIKTSPSTLPTGIITTAPAVDVFGAPVEVAKKEDLGIKVTRQEKEMILSRARNRMNSLPDLEIDDITYSLYSHEELMDIKEFTVRKTDEYGIHSVNDPRGGVVDNDKMCKTCHTDNLTCPGHIGAIILNQEIIHPMFRREVIDVLTSVCNSCGGLLIPEATLESKGILRLTGSKRLRAIADASKNIPCRRQQTGAGMENVTRCISNPVYKASTAKDLGKIFYSHDKKKGGKENAKTVEEIDNILSAISPEDAAVLGFDNDSHPSRFILKSIPVIPICARAPVIQDGEVLKDDLTSMYIDIVRYNQELTKTDLGEKDRENIVNALVFSIEHMIDNADSRYRQGKKKPYLDIKGRIQGKEAIIRNLIQGKRVNYSARTVLGPEPNVKFGQIRIPKVMAPFLTYPEIVSASNINRLRALFKKGHVTHITPKQGRYSGKRLRVNDKVREEQQLKFGDTVDRWLQNGDYVVFNRQPTLHKQGIMGYEVVLGDPLTIGLHLSSTGPHNADFDGDEGTIHAPQSEEAMLEVANLMCIKNNIMNSQNNKNIIGVVMDALTGAYLMTQPETRVDRDVFNDIVVFLENKSGIDTLYDRLDNAHVPRNSGRALFSSILPENFYYRKNDVLIRDGILLSGVITKDNIGSTHGSIIQVMMKDHGQETTVDFLTDIYNIMGKWLDARGFSVGLDDCFLVGRDPFELYVEERSEGLVKLPEHKDKDPDDIKELAKKLKKGEWKRDWDRKSPEDRKIYQNKADATPAGMTIQKEVQRAKMLVRSMGWKLEDPLEEERRENQVMAYLNTAKGLGARISEENLAADNALNVMSKSGAKGSTFNIAQITGILGQQFVQGQRMPETISGGRRCLPYFSEDSLEPEARGFCSNSFLTGLNPAEQFFHQAGGREGLTDTAIKTAETGSMHHRVVKALEDVKVYKDGSARNAFGVIFQYVYGGDGFDAAMLETVNTKTGKFTSFLNTKRLAGRLNAKYGYKTKGDPEPDGLEGWKVGDGFNGGTIKEVVGDKLRVEYDGTEGKNGEEWMDTTKGKEEEF